MPDPFLIPPPFVLSLSGGRTSAFMLHRVRQAHGGRLPPGGHAVFGNTGREDEMTYRFLYDIERHWGQDVLWVEYSNPAPFVATKGKQFVIGGHGYKLVNFHTADRTGRPFLELVRAKAFFRRHALGQPPVLPNKSQRWCSGELKVRTISRAVRETLGLAAWTSVVGLRADEPHRLASLVSNDTRAIRHVAPLIEADVSEAEVLDFWKGQPFDLGLVADPVLGTYRGNCDFCFLKAAAKRRQLLEEIPGAADWWLALEDETGQSFYGKKAVSLRRLVNERIPLEQCSTEDEGPCICTGD